MTQLYFGETTESLGNMEAKYGILPLPKFDEAQEGYYTNALGISSPFSQFRRRSLMRTRKSSVLFLKR